MSKPGHDQIRLDVNKSVSLRNRRRSKELETAEIRLKDHEKVILMVGNPNVGKSAIFSKLTGVTAENSNYAGTAVGFTRGEITFNDSLATLVDVPGNYTLAPTSEAEVVASKFIPYGDIIVNVVDATNLERNLYLTLELLELGKPMILALNMWDEVAHHGIEIDLPVLSAELGISVVAVSAMTGQGLKELVRQLPYAEKPEFPRRSKNERWAYVGDLVEKAQKRSHRHHKWYERLADATVRPFPGILIAFFVMVLGFLLVRFIGEGLINYIFDPIFENWWLPVVERIGDALGGSGFWHDILIGYNTSDGIDFVVSFGLLTSGLYVPFALILPYIVAFYIFLGLLENSGYLPRLAVLLDSLMHKVGLHGYAIIPTFLGFGCNVPAIIGTRVLENNRARFISATLVAIAVPCAGLQAMIFGLIGQYGFQYVLLVYGILALVWLVLGLILNKVMKGYTPELIMEVPPYRLPPMRLVFTKLWRRILDFLKEAVPIMILAIFINNIFMYFGLMDVIGVLFEPIVSNILGLPAAAAVPLVLGALRKDAALGIMATLSLTAGQMVVGALVLAMIFPCLAVFTVMLKELGPQRMFFSTLIMMATAITVGGLVNLGFHIFS